MPHVDSSAISRVDYDPASSLLTVQFRNSRRYAYRGVPRFDYEALLAAESKGTFVNTRIKPRYEVEELPS